MAKIGRNERCPCGSGKKYKRCCASTPVARRRVAAAGARGKVSLMEAVEKICLAAADSHYMILDRGVFVLFATEQGNGWLCEVTQADCVQVAENGTVLPSPINEDSETIEIEWSHTFKIVDKSMVLTAYGDRSESVLADCPVKEVSALIRRISKKIPAELLGKIHIDPESAGSMHT